MSVVQSASPQKPDDVVVSVAEATAGDVAKVVRRAHDAQGRWAAAAPAERANALHAAADAVAAAADELTALAVREVGKGLTMVETADCAKARWAGSSGPRKRTAELRAIGHTHDHAAAG
jgi:delta 1-pyrroline-5-carboxylate dehydrogenase